MIVHGSDDCSRFTNCYECRSGTGEFSYNSCISCKAGFVLGQGDCTQGEISSHIPKGTSILQFYVSKSAGRLQGFLVGYFCETFFVPGQLIA